LFFPSTTYYCHNRYTSSYPSLPTKRIRYVVVTYPPPIAPATLLDNKFSAASLNAPYTDFAVGVLTSPLTKGNSVPFGIPDFLFGAPVAS
jgi:hypothetical protein